MRFTQRQLCLSPLVVIFMCKAAKDLLPVSKKKKTEKFWGIENKTGNFRGCRYL